tara:strand:- start:1144 stop:1314 length:171 start_codon:yes stop_codon:yes gene_type:complete
MKLDLTKKDINVLLQASEHFTHAPEEFDLPNYKDEYNHWQKLKNRLLDALNEMENN